MRYFYTKSEPEEPKYGKPISLDHPVYKFGTLYEIEGRGLIVTQLRFDSGYAFWGQLDPGLANDIFTNHKFLPFFSEKATIKPYPIVQVRSVMWALRMKPLRREEWEGYF